MKSSWKIKKKKSSFCKANIPEKHRFQAESQLCLLPFQASKNIRLEVQKEDRGRTRDRAAAGRYGLARMPKE